jgi:hypothetical protein
VFIGLPSNGHEYKVFFGLSNDTSCMGIDRQKLAKIFNFKTLFFYKTCVIGDVSQDGILQQALRMKNKRVLKSFTYRVWC